MFERKRSPEQELPGGTSTVGQNVILAELARDYMHDKKVRRRWKTIITLLIIVYLLSTLFVLFKDKNTAAYGKPHTALIELNGSIGTEMGISSDQINQSLRNAFASKMAKGVVMRINSPGGTPVQSAEINQEITRLRAKYPDKPMHVVVSDLCASGGYFVAVAAEMIFANRSSLVGSIGVRLDSFGFVEAMKKYGIERRSITAGENKAMLDPFLPMKPGQKAHAEIMLNQVHQHFIEVVKRGRGERLSSQPDLFSGLFWSGEEAKRLGLVDDFASLDSVARDVIGAEEVVDYTVQPNFFDQFSRQFGVAVGAGIGKVLVGAPNQIN